VLVEGLCAQSYNVTYYRASGPTADRRRQTPRTPRPLLQGCPGLWAGVQRALMLTRAMRVSRLQSLDIRNGCTGKYDAPSGAVGLKLPRPLLPLML